MRLDSVTLNGFKCFPVREEFDFTRGPGLYFLTGRNEQYPELGANAVGKSSLLDGISWALFGKTVRKLKARDVQPWGSTGFVGVTLGIDGQYLRRSRNPNNLCWADSDGLELQPIQQAELDEYLGLSFEAFTNSILFGQFTRPFLDLLPSEKERLFSDTLALDKWLDYCDGATSKVNSMGARISTLEKERARIEGELAQIEEADYKAQAKNWERENAAQIQSVLEDLDDTARQLKRLRKNLQALAVQRTKAKEAITDIAMDLQEASNESRDLSEVWRRRNDLLVAATTRCTAARNHLAELDDNGKCGLCGQPVSDSHFNKLSANISELEAKVESANAKAESAGAARKAAERKMTALQKERTEYKDSLAKADALIAADNTYASRLRNDENALQATVIALERKSNPFATLEKDRAESAILMRKELAISAARVQSLTDQLAAYRYWIRGFKGVRLFLMDDRLLELEYEVNNALGALGLPDWNIAFTTERAVGRGSKRRYRPGFCVRIDNGSGDSVPWEAWSGGESQRLRLAGSMGYANMILNHAGVTANIEFWDEPSTWLSEAGIESLLDTLASRAEEIQKQIWVVDHRALTYGGFSETVTVVKTERGSYFETQ